MLHPQQQVVMLPGTTPQGHSVSGKPSGSHKFAENLWYKITVFLQIPADPFIKYIFLCLCVCINGREGKVLLLEG